MNKCFVYNVEQRFTFFFIGGDYATETINGTDSPSTGNT